MKTLSVFLLSALFLTACAQTASPPKTEQEILKQEWYPTFSVIHTAHGICDSAITTVKDFQQGEIDSSKAEFELSSDSYFLSHYRNNYEIWVPSYENWDLSNEVTPYKIRIEKDIDLLIDMIRHELEDEIISDDFSVDVEEVCNSFIDTKVEMENAALNAGMTEESLGEIKTEIQEGIERAQEMAEEMLESSRE